MKRILALTAILICLFAPMTSAHASGVTARIKGTVTDPVGAVIPGITVTATNQATGVKYTTTSSSTGDYNFPALPIGTYTVAAIGSGFKGFSASGILLNLDQEYVEPIKLALGSANEQVQVEADSVQVNTTDMQLNNIVNAAQMVELPLIGRNFTSLELTQPGVQLPDTRFGGAFSVSGAQAQQSEYLINGADTNDIALNTLALSPNLDAIEQFNLIDGPLNAEYDRNSGGIVSATIKQGTNHFHGDAFEFYRDTFLNTQGYFQKTYDVFGTGKLTSTTPAYHQHVFGGTVGGPIFHDKLFFFGAYQGTRQRVPQGTFTNTLPSATNLAGNFSGDLGAFSTNPIPASVSIPGCVTGQTFASCLTPKGGILAPSSFNPLATSLLKYLPTANNGANGFNYNSTAKTSADQYIGRIDFSLNPRNQFTALGLYNKSILSEGIPFSGASVPGFGDGQVSHIQQWTFDYVSQINANTVNDLSAHYTRFNFNAGAPQTVAQPSAAGFSITPEDAANATLPSIAVSGGASFTLGGTTNGPQPRIDQVIQLDDNFSKTFGRHNLKFGYDGRRFNVSNTFDNSNSGAFGFNNGGTYSSGDGLLDFLLGIPASYSQGTGAVIQADAYLNYVYGQDTWRVTNNLTLSYGLGYSIDTPLRNHQYGGLAVSCFSVGANSVVFPGAPTNLLFPGDNGCTNAGQAHTRHTEFGPRFGFAWAPDLGFISGAQGKFSIRGGFGIYYNRTEEESALQTLGTPPFGFTSGGAADFNGSPQLKNPYADINNGKDPSGAPLSVAVEANRFPYIPPVKGAKIDFTQYYPIYNISSFDGSFRAPYSENFQLSVERELPSKIVTRVSYIGSLGRHNQVGYEGNYTTAAGQAACAASAACIANRNIQSLAYPTHTIGNSANFPEIGEVGSYSSSNYNSLQVSVTKAPTHGLVMQVSYTYAHAMDDASSFENSGFGESGQRGYNQYNKLLNYGDSTFDTRHHLVISPVYITPLVRNRSPFSPISLAISGWEVSGIIQFASGQPFDISYAGATSRSLYCSAALSFYACPDVPLQTAPLIRSNPRIRQYGTKAAPLPGYGQWFSPTTFAAEPIGTFGNIHRNPYHGGGSDNTNMVLAKNFILSGDGTIRLQLRMESDNVFNHTQFTTPVSGFTSGNFGNVTSQVAARQTQLAAKIYF